MISLVSIFFYLWIVSNAYPLNEPQQCPDKFVKLDNSCYFFSNGTSENRNWTDAEKFCEERNSHLISIETTQELSAINSYGILGNHKREWYWTSGSDLQNKNDFIWIEMQRPIIHNWCLNFPKAETSRRCVLVELDLMENEHCLVNVDCASQWMFICESKLKQL